MLLRVLAISCRYCGLTTSRVPRQITYISPGGLFLRSRSHVKDPRGRDAEKSFPCQSRTRRIRRWGKRRGARFPSRSPIVGWIGPRDSLRAHLDPRSFTVPRMSHRGHSHEGRSHYRPRREKRRKKEVSVVRFASWEKARPCYLECTRAREREGGKERGSLVSPLRPFTVGPQPFSIAFCNYSRVYDLVCAPRSVNRATRGPRPIECGTRWCGDDTDDTGNSLSLSFSLIFLLRFTIIPLLQFFPLAFILASCALLSQIYLMNYYLFFFAALL